VTSIPLVSRTRATLRSAEFGFFGVVVYTRVHTPRRWGAATRRLRALADFRPGVASFFLGALRPLRTSCEVVGMRGGMLAGRFGPPGARWGWAKPGPGTSSRVSQTRKTVYVAMAANAVIALAKLLGGVVSGSAAMLAEAAHSLADTTNQVLLLVSLSLGQRPPDEEHPFGYGKERFLWAFLAAVFIFVAGALFSIGEGVRRLLGASGGEGSALVAFAVLAVAFLAEGASLIRAWRQTRREAADAQLPMRRFIPESRNPTAKTVVFEDSVAVLGVIVAAAGLGLEQATGSSAWDAGASIVIGLLLAAVAVALGRDTKGLLLGEAALPEERRALREAIERRPEVDELLELLTMAIGPEALLVAARVDLADGLDSDRIERVSSEIDRDLREAVPAVAQVFVDATARREREENGRI